MYTDYTKIFVKSGNGGNGAISFRREKYVAAGGPTVEMVEKVEMYTLLQIKIQTP